MRTWAIIITIFVLLGTGVVWSGHYLDSTSVALAQDIDKVAALVEKEEWVEAESHLGKVKKDWDKSKNVWSILVTHRDIDDIDLTLKHLEQCIRSKELIYIRCDLATLRFLIEQTAESHSFILRNIL